MQPLELFPRLVWEKILQKIEDPQDKLMILDIHPQLEKEFGFEKDQWQFPAILPILFDSFNLKPYNYGRIFFSYGGEKKETPNTKLLTCRSVSSLSLKAINKYLDSYWKQHLAPPSCITHDSGKLIWLENIEHFEKNYPITSIIGKVAQIGIPLYHRPKGCCCHGQRRDNDHPKPCEEKRTELLRKIGKTLKGLDINFYFQRSSELIEYRALLMETFELVPNVETLRLECEWFDEVIDDIADMEEFISLPILSKVTRLEIQGGIQSDSRLKRLNVLQYFPQLTKLNITMSLWRSEYNNKGLFPNLEFLYMFVHLGVAGEKDEFEIFFERLDMPKLKKMHLDLFVMSNNVKYEEREKLARSVKDTAIEILRMKYPNPGWTETWNDRRTSCIQVEFHRINATAADPVTKR